MLLRTKNLDGKYAIKRILFPLFLIFGGILYQYGISQHYGLPEPIIHDEFAYLLAADTFANGRLTNPTPPFWEHFQSFHIFLKPTYQAKYPPLQGLFLALGQTLFGSPIWGVWICMAFGYAATYWLFLSTFKPWIAFVGAMIVLTHPFITAAWGQSYWGGGAAMLGGALYFGGIRHSLNRISYLNSIFICIGIAILANSRPYEGFIACLLSIPVLLTLIKNNLFTKGINSSKALLIPICISILLLIGWVLYYNFVLSGDPFKFYYYNWDQKLSTIDHIQNYKGSYDLSEGRKLIRLWAFFIGPYLSISILGMIYALFRKKFFFEFFCVCIVAAASIFYSRAWPHYIAPVVSVLFLLILNGILEFSTFAPIKYKKLAGICFTVFMVFYFAIASFYTTKAMIRTRERLSKSSVYLRKQVINQLSSDSTKDLLFVKYDVNHKEAMEWVYNQADIINADIIWAHSLGEIKDRKLADFFRQRNIWFLYTDSKPIKLIRVRDPIE